MVKLKLPSLPGKKKNRGKNSNNKNLDRNELPFNEEGYRDGNASAGGLSSNINYESLDDNTVEAEQDLLSNLEAQSKRTVASADGFRPAVPGERAPLGLESLGAVFGDPFQKTAPPSILQGNQRFKNMAQRVQMIQRMKSNRSLRSDDSAGMGHRRAKTLLASIGESSNHEGSQDAKGVMTDFSLDLFAKGDNANQPLEFEGLNFLWNEQAEGSDPALSAAGSSAMMDSNIRSERRPLLLLDEGGTPADAARIQERRRMAQQRRNELRWRKIRRCLNPIGLFQQLVQAVLNSTLMVSIPLFIAAWILFYHLRNPQFDFLPGEATLSWWFNFIGRQLVVFELARFTEYILIDILTMSSKFVVQILGPWITIFCLQSKGWPFLVAFWGLFDLFLLHGDNNFQAHWLYWTGIRIYSKANSGSYILTSSAYLRVLIGMILAGVATTLKRTILTMHFGKRSFDIYKPKLEEILGDIIVITEIAELGSEADNLPDDTEDMLDAKQLIEENLKKGSERSDVRWSSLRFHKEKNRTMSVDSDSSELEKNDPDGLETPAAVASTASDTAKMAPRSLLRSAHQSNSSGLIRIKNLLDRWNEPVNKLDKATDSSVNDILKFRKALTYMDLEHPFGEAFGRASTRDELIQSAQTLYQRLLKLSPSSRALPYSVLTVLTENEDGTVDKSLKKAIGNLFRADRDDEISILYFIQTCDIVYRKLRYFRASVGNASVIDKVLEGIINSIFTFAMTIVIMSLLNFNPWPLLVSLSTLLVSFAFAIGPTAAKAIEGILLIVVTRPFDIGDRVIIANTAGAPSPGLSNSWFVEDITLFSTTLRMGANNEVAIVSNGAIAGSRITNCARSKNATVQIKIKLHISFHEGPNVANFKEAIENYILDNRTIWDSLVFLRCDEINNDEEYVIYTLAVRSSYNWQVGARVMVDRGRLDRFCNELTKKLDVAFDSPSSRRVLYWGGQLVDGAIQDYKKNLLLDRNNISGDGDIFGPTRAALQERAPLDTPSSREVADDTTAPDTLDSAENSAAANDLFLSMVQQSH